MALRAIQPGEGNFSYETRILRVPRLNSSQLQNRLREPLTEPFSCQAQDLRHDLFDV
jgi:hypothetical protein